MGHAGFQDKRDRARALRAEAATLAEIADELGVAKSTVSTWVRDVAFVPRARNRGAPGQHPHPATVARLREVAELHEAGRQQIGALTDCEFLIAGVALYAGEGSKGDRVVGFANTDPGLVLLFVEWLRRFFDIDEGRLRARIYLHADLDLDAAQAFWSDLLDIPAHQFGAPHRPSPAGSRRTRRHVHGCVTVRYSSSAAHRTIMGMIEGLLIHSPLAFRGSSIGRAADC